MKLGLAEFTSKVVGTTYELGRNDCLTVVLRLCDQHHLQVPKELEGITRENYKQFYENDPNHALEVFQRFVESVGKEILPVYAFAGDFLVLRVKKKVDARTFVGIHAGGDRFLSAFVKEGMGLGNLRLYDVLKAYRWRSANGR